VIQKVLDYAKENEARNVERLKEFLRIPSISTDPDRTAEMKQAGQWVADLLNNCGIKAELAETGGHPCVVGDTGPVDGDGPTVLLYGHYDVQPVGDRSLWDADPFEPTDVDGKIIARGSADDKGQVLTHLLAAEAWMKTVGKMPVRFKYLIEGEEEVGSPNLASFIEKNRDRLACDYVALSDTCKLDADSPAITYGTKGMIYKELEITGPVNDLHSGSFGGTVTNPGNALCQIIASLRDEKNRVTIPGFYDDVVAVTDDERKLMQQLPFDDGKYAKMLGVDALDGEAGFTTLERRWARPTLDVNGLFGGFMEEGSSTIIPAKMGAKVSMRIVPNQDPDKISKAFDEAVRSATPPGVRLTIREHANCAAYMCPIDLPAMGAAVSALESAFGKKPFMIREGGSLPILPMFKQTLGAETIMIGLCWPNCNAHGPNEFFHRDDFQGGIRTSAHFAANLKTTG
jgi:acetylornithine deacetylase/succinyl-diaminopimelate desuccinylase-like protein